MTITVLGSPAPKGSRKFVGLSKAGRGILIESSKHEKPWKDSVIWAAREELSEARLGVSFPGAVETLITFTVAKPKSAPKKSKTWPDKRPDLDKCCRSVFDALVMAGVIEDDSRIVRLVASKVYPGEGTDALAVPGAVIHIRAVEA